jgi:hypothetical protein
VSTRHKDGWNDFVIQLGTDITRLHPTTVKILKKLNSDMKENVKWYVMSKHQSLQQYQGLWTQK